MQKLCLEGNFIQDITPLSNLTSLQVLNLKYNDICDVAPLAKLDNLRRLKLNKNLVKNWEILPLKIRKITAGCPSELRGL